MSASAGDLDTIGARAGMRPRRVWVDKGMQTIRGAPWRVRPQGAATSPPSRPSALFLALPGAALLLGRRPPSFRWRKDGGDAHPAELVLSVAIRGGRRVEHLGRVVEGGGTGLFMSTFEAGRGFCDDDGQYLGVVIPAAPVLERAPDVADRLMRPIAAESPALRLLTRYVSGLLASPDGIAAEAAPLVARHVADLCALMLGGERHPGETEAVRAAELAAVREAIAAGAATPGFGVATVAEQLAAPSRYVHDLLDAAGLTFDRLVAMRRLEIVRARLADPQFDRLGAADLASACGFADFAQFSRLFFARFGEPPEAIRARRRARS